ncbi:type II secretion system protein N [Reinekea thalattae]|nr:type II secretion system protein N [Reinekea thalattae]
MKFFNIKLVIIFVASYLLVLVVTAPIQWWLPKIIQPAPSTGILLQNPQGNIWQGQVHVLSREVQPVTVSWDLSPYKLILLQAAVDFSLSGQDIALTGKASFSPLGMRLRQLSGYADEPFVAPLMQQYKTQVTGRLTVQQLAFNLGWNHSIGDLEGQLVWSGGNAQMSVNRRQQTYQVPMMMLNLQGDSDGWLGQVLGSQQQSFMTLSLTPEGRASISVKRLLAEALSIQLPGSTESILDFSQQVF